MAALPAQLERTLSQFARGLPYADMNHLVDQAIVLRADASAQALTDIQCLAVLGVIAPAGGFSKVAALDAFVTAAAGTVSATPTIAGLDFSGCEIGPLALDATSLSGALAATGCRWTDCTFDGTDLTGATLTSGDFQRCRVDDGGIKLDGANMTSTVCTDGFRRIHAGAVSCKATNWTTARLERADLSDVIFSSTATAGNLTGAVLQGADLSGAKFHDNASTPAHGATLTAATVLKYADLRDADLSVVTTMTGVAVGGARANVATKWKTGFAPTGAGINFRGR